MAIPPDKDKLFFFRFHPLSPSTMEDQTSHDPGNKYVQYLWRKKLAWGRGRGGAHCRGPLIMTESLVT